MDVRRSYLALTALLVFGFLASPKYAPRIPYLSVKPDSTVSTSEDSVEALLKRWRNAIETIGNQEGRFVSYAYDPIWEERDKPRIERGEFRWNADRTGFVRMR